MAEIIQMRTRRLIHPDDVPWMTIDERLAARREIKRYTDIAAIIEERQELNPEQAELMEALTGSTNLDTWANCAFDTTDRVAADYYAKLRLMAQHDLTAYHEYMNPDEFPAPHHIWLCDKLMKVESGLIKTFFLSAPPGSAKSSYGSRSFVQWSMGRNPNWKVLMGGYNQTFSDNEFSKPNRDALLSEKFREIFPDVFVSETDRAMDSWKLDGTRGKYYSRGANAGVAGVRANLTNLDDPIGKAETAKSPTERDKLWRWMTTDILPRRLPNNRLVIIATRWMSDDIIGRLEALYKENPTALIGPVEIINLPAQAGENDPLGRQPGEWLWEKNSDGSPHYTAQHYETLRLTMPAGDWSALYMGIPLDLHGDFVSEDQFQRYDTYPQNIAGQPNQIAKTVVSVDTAQTANERSDFTAITVWRKGVDNIHYLVYAERVKQRMELVIPLLNRIASNWSANYFLIENAGFGSQIIQNYQGKMVCPIVEFSPHSRSSKAFGFEAAVPYIMTGLCKFPKMAPWLADFINELVAFTGDDDAHDDYVDSFSQYILHMNKQKRGGTKKLKFRT